MNGRALKNDVAVPDRYRTFWTEENNCCCHRLVNVGSDIQAGESGDIWRVVEGRQVKSGTVEHESKKKTGKEREVVGSC